MSEPTPTPTKLFRDWHAARTGTPFFVRLVKPSGGRALRCWPGDDKVIECIKKAIHPWLYEVRPVYGAQHPIEVIIYDAEDEDDAREANLRSPLGCMIRFDDIYSGKCVLGRIGDDDKQDTIGKAAPSRVIRLQQAQRWGTENVENPWYKVASLAFLFNNSERASLIAVIMHEFGHLLGLPHSLKNSSVLWAPQLERDPRPRHLQVGWKATQFLHAADSATVAQMLRTLAHP